MRISIIVFLFLIVGTASSAQENREIRKNLKQGNKHYHNQEFDEAQNKYQQALDREETNFKAQFNLGNALYKNKQYEKARAAFNHAQNLSNDKIDKAKSFHNIGNTFTKEEKWEDAIKAYKNALKQNPHDQDTKYNLAYAQTKLKQEQENQDDQDQEDQDDQDNRVEEQDENKDQDQNEEEQNQEEKDDQNEQQQDSKEEDNQEDNKQKPQPQPSKLTEEEAERLLDAIQQEEKKLHDDKKNEKGIPINIEKDW